MEGKKRGRPKGSRNVPVVGKVVEVPPRCFHCDSVKIRVMEGRDKYVSEKPYQHPTHGLIVRHERRHMICESCGKRFIKHTLFPADEN
jgi:hypothetical protein